MANLMNRDEFRSALETAIQGKSLLTIGKLLGHVDPKTTAIYAHLTEVTVKEAADNTSEELSKHLQSNDFIKWTKHIN